MIGLPDTSPMVNRRMLNPNQNYYRFTTAMGAGTAYILACEIGLLGFALYYGIASTPVWAAFNLRVGCISPPTALWAIVLVSFPMDLLANRKSTDWYMWALQAVNVVLITSASGGLMFALLHSV